jgi:hypothetical protein
VGPVAFCTNCGHRNPPEANFCSSCGAVLDTGANTDTTVTLRPVDVLGEPGAEEVTVSLPERADTGLLVVKHGPNAGTRFVLDAPVISVGRHPESGIFLDDITVSRRHAEFRQEEGGYTVCDVGSLNGTYVNHERIDRARLASGDEVQVGKFKLVFLAASDE